MVKRYLSKIIAKDSQGLQLISACCAGAKVKISEIKYLPKNKIFLLSLERFSKEADNDNLKINSICKFEFVDSLKSKNIDQNDPKLILELIAIYIFKSKHNFEITFLFSENGLITLTTEVIEATLIDQRLINDKNS